MKVNRTLPLLVFLGMLAAPAVKGQFVHLSRCHAAYPCLIPFGLQYSPDPLIAGPYAQPFTTAVSGRIELKTPLKVEIDKPIDQKAIDEAVRKTIEIHDSAKNPPGVPPTSLAAPPKPTPPKS
jgi:hypothetical protein